MALGSLAAGAEQDQVVDLWLSIDILDSYLVGNVVLLRGVTAIGSIRARLPLHPIKRFRII
jgi:hypothetical protein